MASRPAARWRERRADAAVVALIAGELGVGSTLAAVLAGRGHTVETAARFLDPRLDSLSRPETFPGVPEVAGAVGAAMRANRRIAVYGDYDADGLTGSALLVSVLQRLGADASAFLPRRRDEGYGLTDEGLQRCLEETAAEFIVTVDCGTRGVAQIENARRRGVEIVVTDHHEPAEGFQPVCPTANPKLGAPPGAEDLSGVGVAFKVCHALVAAGRRAGDPRALALDLRDDLDLVAVGTVADVVPLSGENRVLVRHGLERLGATRRPGLRALLETADVVPPVRAHHVGFRIAPRLNALGRIDDAMAGLGLLLEQDPVAARRTAAFLETMNRERQRIENIILDEAAEAVEAEYGAARPAALVVARRGWHPGVIGIVAARLARAHYLPAVVIGIDDDGLGKGSGRSVEGVSLVDCLAECAGVLERFGGHPMAAGLTLLEDRVEEFRALFDAAVRRRVEPEELAPTIHVEAIVSTADITESMAEELDRLQPLGPGNREPVLAMRGVEIVDARPMGAADSHVRLRIVDGHGAVDAVAWNTSLDELGDGTVDVAGRIRVDDFQGVRRIRFQLEAVRASA